MSGEERGWFTRPAGPLLNASLCVFLLSVAFALDGRVTGFPTWGYVVAGLLALIIVPSSVRRLDLDGEGLLVRGWRARVALGYGEVDRVEVLRKRVTPVFTPAGLLCGSASRGRPHRLDRGL